MRDRLADAGHAVPNHLPQSAALFNSNGLCDIEASRLLYLLPWSAGKTHKKMG